VAQDSLQAVLGADRVAALHALLDDALSRLDPPPPGPHEVHDEH
jgi:hypothetical protein